MNKLLLNAKGRNHIRVFPTQDTIEFKGTEAEVLTQVQNLFKQLQESDNVENLYYKKKIKKGYLISAWAYDDLYYLVQCLKDENKMYVVNIYILKSANDAKNIAKFLSENADGLMKDYKKQIIEGKEAFKKFIQEGNC